MDNNCYVLTSDGELYHWGVKGMKWGVRKRRPNKTSDKIRTINEKTNAELKKIKDTGRQNLKIQKVQAKADARLAKAKSKYELKTKADETPKPKAKSIKDMSDDELRKEIARIRLENELKSLRPEQVSSGESFAKSMFKDTISPALKNAGKNVMQDYFTKLGKDYLGLNEKQSKDSLAELRKEVDKLELEKKKALAEDYFENRNKRHPDSNSETSGGNVKKPSDKKVKTEKSNSKNDDTVYEGEVFGEGNSRKQKKKKSGFSDSDYVDGEVVREYAQNGRNYIYGYLEPPKDRRDN